MWRAPDVDEEPTVQLASWQVIEVAADDLAARFLIGRDLAYGQGRMSTPVVSFDADTMIATTRSGRRYELLGAPGHDDGAEYVCNAGMRHYGIGEEYQTDVTAEFWPTGDPGPDVGDYVWRADLRRYVLGERNETDVTAEYRPTGDPGRRSGVDARSNRRDHGRVRRHPLGPTGHAHRGANGRHASGSRRGDPAVIPEGSVRIGFTALDFQPLIELGHVHITPAVQDWIAAGRVEAEEAARLLNAPQPNPNAALLTLALGSHARQTASESTWGSLRFTTVHEGTGPITIVDRP